MIHPFWRSYQVFSSTTACVRYVNSANTLLLLYFTKHISALSTLWFVIIYHPNHNLLLPSERMGNTWFKEIHLSKRYFYYTKKEQANQSGLLDFHWRHLSVTQPAASSLDFSSFGRLLPISLRYNQAAVIIATTPVYFSREVDLSSLYANLSIPVVKAVGLRLILIPHP